MPASEVTYRKAEDADLEHVQQTLYLALAWDPDDPIPPFEPVVNHPEIAIYHSGWMRPGDAGVIAEVDGEFAGMAYYRLFPEDAHGQGFVDPHTPELAIAVVDQQRGRGIGLRLMEELAAIARSAGIEQISLSVSAGNPARRLYERVGYRDGSDSDPELMVLRLD
ncbi:MAG: GNAT family N-acetyltransferase [Acidimicrobiia bacterium]